MDSSMRGARGLRLGRALALLGVFAVAALAASSAALAVDNDPDNDPRIPPAKPNLVIGAASVAEFGTSQWEIRYTVANRGNAATPSFHVAVQEIGKALIKDTFNGSLAAGATRTEVIHVNRTGCYIPVQFVADSTRVVGESNELDNQRWAVGLTSPSCATLPKYKVKAVSFHAVDESGIDALGSDEPYWIFSSVGATGTKRTTASHVFKDIDTGDTAFFGASEGCIYLSCAGGAAPFGIGMSIQLWEQDNGDLANVLRSISSTFSTAGTLASVLSAPTWVGTAIPIVGAGLNVIASALDDDLLGTQTFAYDPAFLAAALPAVGASFNDTRSFVDSGSLGASYTLTLAVSRVG